MKTNKTNKTTGIETRYKIIKREDVAAYQARRRPVPQVKPLTAADIRKTWIAESRAAIAKIAKHEYELFYSIEMVNK